MRWRCRFSFGKNSFCALCPPSLGRRSPAISTNRGRSSSTALTRSSHLVIIWCRSLVRIILIALNCCRECLHRRTWKAPTAHTPSRGCPISSCGSSHHRRILDSGSRERIRVLHPPGVRVQVQQRVAHGQGAFFVHGYAEEPTVNEHRPTPNAVFADLDGHVFLVE